MAAKDQRRIGWPKMAVVCLGAFWAGAADCVGVAGPGAARGFLRCLVASVSDGVATASQRQHGRLRRKCAGIAAPHWARGPVLSGIRCSVIVLPHSLALPCGLLGGANRLVPPARRHTTQRRPGVVGQSRPGQARRGCPAAIAGRVSQGRSWPSATLLSRRQLLAGTALEVTLPGGLPDRCNCGFGGQQPIATAPRDSCSWRREPPQRLPLRGLSLPGCSCRGCYLPPAPCGAPMRCAERDR